MSGSYRVLTYGKDVALLNSRCQLLERAGYSAKLVIDLAAVLEGILLGKADLSIICHSVPVEEREEIARSKHIQLKTYQLASSISPKDFLQQVASMFS